MNRNPEKIKALDIEIENSLTTKVRARPPMI